MDFSCPAAKASHDVLLCCRGILPCVYFNKTHVAKIRHTRQEVFCISTFVLLVGPIRVSFFAHAQVDCRKTK